MSARFVELDHRVTPMGELVLRRRRMPGRPEDIYEVKLGDDFLMSSLFTVAEEEMARLALAAVTGDALDVVVGGLGLGYTARTVLESPRVRSLVVVEALAPVIEWHRDGLVPAAAAVVGDARCTLAEGDFFALLAAGVLDGTTPGRRFDAVVVDIDHSPRHVLHDSHAAFYDAAGVAALTAVLRPGGVFALWSNDPPDDAFTARLGAAFGPVEAVVVRFPNPLQDREAAHTVYVATTDSQPPARPLARPGPPAVDDGG